MTHPKLVETMLQPSFYPHVPGHVEFIQTHISYIFIAGDLVYKVKKAVDFGFLDFTTLGKRKYYCDEEVRLNQRFAHGVYLDVVRIMEDSKGNLHLKNGSNIVEYAVEMKKIPEHRMLYRLLDEHKVSHADMRRIGRYLADVYGTIPASDKSREFGSLDVIATNVIENFDQTRKYIGGPVSHEKFAAIETWSREFMQNNAVLFERRITEGQIKDCHGDLHLQHICLDNDKIFIFDCIEFNERFRFGDVASDVAFLSMDFDYNGKSALGNSFVEAYITESGDATMRDVLIFYKVYRAYVRAKVTSFLLDDEALDDTARHDAFQKAARYYDLAYGYIFHEN